MHQPSKMCFDMASFIGVTQPKKYQKPIISNHLVLRRRRRSVFSSKKIGDPEDPYHQKAINNSRFFSRGLEVSTFVSFRWDDGPGGLGEFRKRPKPSTEALRFGRISPSEEAEEHPSSP